MASEAKTNTRGRSRRVKTIENTASLRRSSRSVVLDKAVKAKKHEEDRIKEIEEAKKKLEELRKKVAEDRKIKKEALKTKSEEAAQAKTKKAEARKKSLEEKKKSNQQKKTSNNEEVQKNTRQKNTRQKKALKEVELVDEINKSSTPKPTQRSISRKRPRTVKTAVIVQNPSSKPGPKPAQSRVKITKSILNHDRTVVSRSKRRELEAERREINYQNNILMKQKRDEIVLSGIIKFFQENEILKKKHQEQLDNVFNQDSNRENIPDSNFIEPQVLPSDPLLIDGTSLVTYDDRTATPTSLILSSDMNPVAFEIRPDFDSDPALDDQLPYDPELESSGNSFPKKIWNIVERRSCKSVWWFVDGRSFVINKRWIKENGEILDGNNKWMNISDYSSLVRQLNLYGFRKVKRVGNELSQFHNHAADIKGRHPYVQEGNFNIQDLDEFRHTFFRRDGDDHLCYEKVQFIKRQKPFKPTNSQREPAKFNPQIQKVSARRPKYAAPNSPRSDSDGSSIFDRYDDSDQELDSLALPYYNPHFPGQFQLGQFPHLPHFQDMVPDGFMPPPPPSDL